jgi:hypothetical protein
MKIVSLGLEAHGFRSHAALKSARGVFQNKHGVSLAVITATTVDATERAHAFGRGPLMLAIPACQRRAIFFGNAGKRG